MSQQEMQLEEKLRIYNHYLELLKAEGDAKEAVEKSDAERRNYRGTVEERLRLYHANKQAQQLHKSKADECSQYELRNRVIIDDVRYKLMDDGQTQFEIENAKAIEAGNAKLAEWAGEYKQKHSEDPIFYIQSDIEGVLLGNKGSPIQKINPRFVHMVQQMQKHVRVILDINSVAEIHSMCYQKLQALVPNETILQVIGDNFKQNNDTTKWRAGEYEDWASNGFTGSKALYEVATAGSQNYKAAMAVVLMMYRRDILREDVTKYHNFFFDNDKINIENFQWHTKEGMEKDMRSYPHKAPVVYEWYKSLNAKSFNTVGILNYIDLLGNTQKTGKQLKGEVKANPLAAERDAYGGFLAKDLEICKKYTEHNGEGTGTLSSVKDSNTLYEVLHEFVKQHQVFVTPLKFEDYLKDLQKENQDLKHKHFKECFDKNNRHKNARNIANLKKQICNTESQITAIKRLPYSKKLANAERFAKRQAKNEAKSSAMSKN